MWYGLATQQAKSEAEAFANKNKVKRNAETIGNIVIRQSAIRDRQAEKDKATWREMQRNAPKI